MFRRLQCFCIATVVLGAGVGAAEGQQFRLVEVPGSTFTIVNGINDTGDVVGAFMDANNVHRGFLRRGSQVTILEYPGAEFTNAHGLNNVGDVVGAYYFDDDSNPETPTVSRGYRWRNGFYTSLSCPGDWWAGATGINDAGTIVGYCSQGAFILSAGSFQNVLFGSATILTGVNNFGEVVGLSWDGVGPDSHFRMINGVVTPISVSAVGGLTCDLAQVYGIANTGTVVGTCFQGATSSVGFVLDAGEVHPIAYPGAVFTQAIGVNSTGSVVGSSDFGGFVTTPGPALIDPVPDLLSGAGITPSYAALGTLGRPVEGVAADGVARVVVRIPAATAGQSFTVRLLNDREPRGLSLSDDEDGALAPIGAQTVWSNQLTVNAETVGDEHMAFAIYRAPEDFPRAGTPVAPGAFGPDDFKASRRVYLEITAMGGQPYVQPVEIVRPPVMLVHGIWSRKESWKDFTPLGRQLDPRFSVDFADYSQSVDVASAVPEPPAGSLTRVLASSLGFQFNAARVREQTTKHIEKFGSGRNPLNAPVAVAQADIVGHSMGGVVTRTWATLPEYVEPDAFGQGRIHKLVSLNTPHLGSPLATALLQPANTCLRNAIVQLSIDVLGLTLKTFKPNNFSFLTATLAGDTVVDGAVGDLVHAPLSVALQRVGASAVRIPTRFVGTLYSKWPSIDGSVKADVLRGKCSTDPLAQKLTSAGWPTLFGEESDGVVGRSSQRDGRTDNAVEEEPDFAHSAGILELGFEGPHAQSPGPVMGRVTDALNRPSYSEIFFRPTPPPQ